MVPRLQQVSVKLEEKELGVQIKTYDIFLKLGVDSVKVN